MDWPKIDDITSQRLRLERLSVSHAPEMVDVLADPSMYEFTGEQHRISSNCNADTQHK